MVIIPLVFFSFIFLQPQFGAFATSPQPVQELNDSESPRRPLLREAAVRLNGNYLTNYAAESRGFLFLIALLLYNRRLLCY